MAKITIQGGLVVAADLGLDIFEHRETAKDYDPKGLRCIGVQNAQREDTLVQYTLKSGTTTFHPLQQHVPMQHSLRSLVVVTPDAEGAVEFDEWTEARLFAAERTRGDGSKYPVLRPAIQLPDDSTFPVTHLLHVISRSLTGFLARRAAKAAKAVGDDIHLELPGKFSLFSGPPVGPLEKLNVDGHESFDELIVASTQRPDEPTSGYPPK